MASTNVVLAVLIGALLPLDNAISQSAGSANTGRVTGTVSLGKAVSGRRSAPRPYDTYGARAKSGSAADTNELMNVVLYVELAPGTTFDAAPAGAARPIVQRDETFLPHTLPVLRGSTISFVNDDPFFHNVFSLSNSRTFDLGRYPKGSSKTVSFPRTGIVQVFCHIHAGMTANVLVLDNPFFATPDASGQFAITAIPAGNHRIVAWHERTGPVARPLVVREGEATVVDFDLPTTVSTNGR